MRKTLIISAIVALTTGLSTMGIAQEKKIQKSDLPAAVQKTAAEQSEGATVRGYSTEMEGGKQLYEVELMKDGHSKDVSMTADGQVAEVEEQVDLTTLPDAVKSGLQEKAGKGTITKVESLTKGGALVAYEAQVKNGARRSEVQVGPEGKALAHPE